METLKEIFTNIYNYNLKNGGLWQSTESVSGTGSTVHETKVIIHEIQLLIEELSIKSILDIPCGDFNWMQRVNLDGVHYMGADIVDSLIAQNNARYRKSNIEFHVLDITQDHLPKVDLMIVRDCFGHLSYTDINAALYNIEKAGPRYLLVTTFTRRGQNESVNRGDWIPLNLMDEPFHLVPLRIINEQCPQNDGAYADKSLMLIELQTKIPRY